ncbi:hypothetical protein SCP_1203550 [Sparassis crispa]|uniref:Protein kinase domain-containing protein n=1 Tax=Sparassis crispa TaxID=139825 RepID=A0A401H121_9APHY|nr:hypothetical protein SCP_1203550 [Sparassis crispa]GBE88125.1 hypothetical protein SCP_1203550 [Sparassis crispa]
MATLSVTFPDNIRSSLRDYNFVSDGPVPWETTVEFVVKEMISESLSSKPSEDRISRILKEAQHYRNELVTLQGDAVPRFHGFYRGKTRTGLQVACLLLEDGGDCLNEDFHDLPMENRVAILTQLAKIHRAGLCHNGEVDTRNVVMHNGRYKFVDFHSAIEHSGCEFDVNNLHPGGPIPELLSLGCITMWYECRDFRIWDDGRIRLRRGVSFFRDDGWPSQEIIDELEPTFIWKWCEEAEEALFNYFNVMVAKLDNGATMEELKRNVNEQFLETLNGPTPDYVRLPQ